MVTFKKSGAEDIEDFGDLRNTLDIETNYMKKEVLKLKEEGQNQCLLNGFLLTSILVPDVIKICTKA